MHDHDHHHDHDTDADADESTDSDDGTDGLGPAAGEGGPDFEVGDDLGDAVEAALRRVRDPEADVNVFEAGLIERIDVDGGEVTVGADLSEFDPAAEQGVTEAMLRAVSDVPGVESASVEHATSTPDPADRDVGVASADTVIAVASAKGGVGKTTVAVNLACALAEGADVGIFDADIHGPNVPAMLDVSGPVYADEDDHPMPVDRDGLEVMSVGLMEEGAPLAWRGAMAHDALTELFEDVAWDDRETLVVDLPPGTGDVVLTTLQETRVDGVVFVTTPFHAAVTDTERSLALFRENDVPVLGVVANMAGFACEACGHDHDLFPGAAPLDDLDVPVLAELDFSPELQGTPDPGSVPDGMERLAERVRDRLAELEAGPAVPDGAVDIRGLAPAERRERVVEAFLARDPGEAFALVSDRDPSPVRPFLARRADVDPAALDPFDVEQRAPETWVLRTVRPDG